MNNKIIKVRTAFNLMLLVICTAALIGVLVTVQHIAAKQQQKILSTSTLDSAVSTIENNQNNAGSLMTAFHEINQSTLEDLRELVTSGMLKELFESTHVERLEKFQDIINRSGVQYLYLIDEKGKAVITPVTDYYGQNLLELGLLTEENLKEIINGTRRDDGTVHPITESNDSGKFYFYSVPVNYISDRYYLVLGNDSDVLDTQYSELSDIPRVLANYVDDENDFMFAVNSDDGTFEYFDNTNTVLTGENASEHGITEEKQKDGFAGFICIDGADYYCVSRGYNNIIIYDAASKDVLYKNSHRVISWSVAAFLIVALLCLSYSIILHNDFRLRNRENIEEGLIRRFTLFGKKFMLNLAVAVRLTMVLMAFVVIIFVVSYYSQTIYSLSVAVDNSEYALSEIEPRITENTSTRDIIQKYYDERFLNKAMLLAYYVEENPSLLNEGNKKTYSEYIGDTKYDVIDSEGNPLQSVQESETLLKLSERNGIADILVYDDQSRVICTTEPEWYFILSNDPEAQSYSFRQVVDNKLDYYVQEPMINDIGLYREYIGTSLNYYTTKDENGDTLYVSHDDYESQKNGTWEGNTITKHHSMLQIGLDSNLIEYLVSSTDVSGILDYINIMNKGFVVCLDNSEDHKVVYSPNKASIDKTASELGISDNAFVADRYIGIGTVNGTKYFQLFRLMGEYYVAAFVPTGTLFSTRFVNSLITAAVCMFFLFILTIFTAITSESEEKYYRDFQKKTGYGKKKNSSNIIRIIMPSGKTKEAVKVASRWDSAFIPWAEKTPDQKFMEMLRYVMIAIVIYIVILIAYDSRYTDSDPIMRYVIVGNWDKGFNIFAFSACLGIMASTYVMVFLLTKVILVFTSMLGTKSATVGHLVISVIKYGSVIMCALACALEFGIATTSLLASAGIVSIIIGLGAQKIIGDVIAGIFIVFDGSFRVGDIVTISDFRGQVLDIGMRTTKVIDIDKNIMIFNNSEISKILNMTKELSVVKGYIDVGYYDSLERVEQIISSEIDGIKKRLPAIVKGPYYMGVTEVKDSSVRIRYDVHCHEKDVPKLTFDFNRELYLACVRGGISIPYPHVTLAPDAAVGDIERPDKPEPDETENQNEK